MPCGPISCAWSNFWQGSCAQQIRRPNRRQSQEVDLKFEISHSNPNPNPNSQHLTRQSHFSKSYLIIILCGSRLQPRHAWTSKTRALAPEVLSSLNGGQIVRLVHLKFQISNFKSQITATLSSLKYVPVAGYTSPPQPSAILRDRMQEQSPARSADPAIHRTISHNSPGSHTSS